MPKLIVQLVTWNSERYIPLLLASLRAQTFRDWSLAVWDNHSTDTTVVRIEQETQKFPVPVAITRHSDNSGFARGHNQLFAAGKSEYVLLLNPDMYLEDDCFANVVAYLDAYSEVAAASPRVMRWDFDSALTRGLAASFTDIIDTLGLRVFRNRRVIDDMTGQQWSDVAALVPHATAVPVFGVSGALPMYRRSALNAVAFQDGTVFDESYTSYKEDVDLAFRLQVGEYQSVVLPSCVAYHDRTGVGPAMHGDWAAVGNKKTQSSYVKYHSYKNHLATLCKNEYWQNFILDFPWIVWYEIKKFGWLLLYDRAVLAGLRELWQARKQIRQKRQDIMSKRQVSWRRLRRWWS